MSLTDGGYGLGSFRGVEFNVMRISATGGRRTTTHEFYAAEESSTEDNGKAPFRVSIDAVVIGDDFYEKRNALIDALHEKGPGTLALPFYDDIPAYVDGTFTVTDSSSALRMSEFSINFVQDYEIQEIEGITSEIDQISSQADLSEPTTSSLSRIISFANQAQHVVDSSVAAVNSAATAIRKISGKINAALNTISEISEAAANISSAAQSLLLAPALLVGNINAAISTIFRSIDAVETAAQTSLAAITGAGPAAIGRAAARMKVRSIKTVSRMAYVFGNQSLADEHVAYFGEKPLSAPGTGASKQVIENNYRQIGVALKCAVISESCLSVESLSFDSAQDMREFMTSINLLVDDVLSDAQDELFLSLRALRASFVSYCSSQIEKLPNERFYTVPSVTSSLALAYKLYGSIEYEPDITLGNNLPNPAAIPAGTVIKIVSSS